MSSQKFTPKKISGFLSFAIIFTGILVGSTIYLWNYNSTIEYQYNGSYYDYPLSGSSYAYIEEQVYFYGPMQQLPSTYYYDFTTTQDFLLGVAYLPGSLALDYYYNPTGDYYDIPTSFSGAEENDDFSTSLVSLEAFTTISVSIDLKYSEEFFLVIFYYMGVSDNTEIQIDLWGTQIGEVPIVEMFLMLGLIWIIGIGIVFSITFPPKIKSKNSDDSSKTEDHTRFTSENSESIVERKKTGKKGKFQKIIGKIFIFLISIMILISTNFLAGYFSLFLTAILLFLTLYQSKFMQKLIDIPYSKGIGALASVYLVGFLFSFSNADYIVNISNDVRAFFFLVAITQDLISPLFWIVLFFIVNKVIKITQYTILENFSSKSQVKPLFQKNWFLSLVRWIITGLFIYQFEYGITFFYDLTEIFAYEGVMDQLKNIIAYAWLLSFFFKFITWIRNKIAKRKKNPHIDESTKESNESWLKSMFQAPDLVEVRDNFQNLIGVSLFFVSMYFVQWWMISLETHLTKLFDKGILDFFSNLSPFENILYLFTQFLFLVAIFILWTYLLKISEEFGKLKSETNQIHESRYGRLILSAAAISLITAGLVYFLDFYFFTFGDYGNTLIKMGGMLGGIAIAMFFSRKLPEISPSKPIFTKMGMHITGYCILALSLAIFIFNPLFSFLDYVLSAFGLFIQIFLFVNLLFNVKALTLLEDKKYQLSKQKFTMWIIRDVILAVLGFVYNTVFLWSGDYLYWAIFFGIYLIVAIFLYWIRFTACLSLKTKPEQNVSESLQQVEPLNKSQQLESLEVIDIYSTLGTLFHPISLLIMLLAIVAYYLYYANPFLFIRDTFGDSREFSVLYFGTFILFLICIFYSKIILSPPKREEKEKK